MQSRTKAKSTQDRRADVAYEPKEVDMDVFNGTMKETMKESLKAAFEGISVIIKEFVCCAYFGSGCESFHQQSKQGYACDAKQTAFRQDSLGRHQVTMVTTTAAH
eukprot:8471681-Alexandrium_andersonii.AAC.1